MDRTRNFRLDMLARDAEAIDQVGTRLAGLIGYIRHAANDASDHATAAALRDMAQGLADAAHNDFAAVIVANEQACEREGYDRLYVIDPILAVTFGMRLPPAALAAIDIAAE